MRRCLYVLCCGLSLCATGLSYDYFAFPKKFVVHIVAQKTLANATNIIRLMNNRYGLNYLEFNAKSYLALFKHPLLINCIYNIETTNSLEPVFFLWDTMGLLIPHVFLYEYSMLIFLIYRDVLFYLAFSTPVRDARYYMLATLCSKITELYNKIGELPLHEIVMIINLLNDELPAIFEDCLEESTLSWYEWLKKHWFKLSVALCTLLIKIIMILKNTHSENSIHMGYIKPTHYAPPAAIMPSDILRNG